jgi:predicted nuclease of predicted toxin-antitoxin system
MKFLVDRCAGRKLAEWLRGQGHDVLESRSLGPDPGDRKLLETALEQGRILVTIDTDFAQLVYWTGFPIAEWFGFRMYLLKGASN